MVRSSDGVGANRSTRSMTAATIVSGCSARRDRMASRIRRSPNRSPDSLAASVKPSVQTQSRSSPATHGTSTDPIASELKPNGGAVAASRRGTPVAGSRNAWGCPALANVNRFRAGSMRAKKTVR